VTRRGPLGRADLQRIAERVVPEGLAIDEGRVRELRTGWLFPYRSATGGAVVGSNGVIVNKLTGKAVRLGSAFPMDRDAAMYERGYCFERYDLVVTGVRDMERTIDALQNVGISVVEPEYEHGTVWRIPRRLTGAELRARLARLPCVFGDLSLYFKCEVMEEAREAGAFSFELLEYRGRA
jgi:hypothetical protein